MEIQLLTRPKTPGFDAAANHGLDSVDDESRCSLDLVLVNDALLGSGFMDWQPMKRVIDNSTTTVKRSATPYPPPVVLGSAAIFPS